MKIYQKLAFLAKILCEMRLFSLQDSNFDAWVPRTNKIERILCASGFSSDNTVLLRFISTRNKKKGFVGV